jgi:hypothetical protein
MLFEKVSMGFFVSPEMGVSGMLACLDAVARIILLYDIIIVYPLGSQQRTVKYLSLLCLHTVNMIKVKVDLSGGNENVYAI